MEKAQWEFLLAKDKSPDIEPEGFVYEDRPRLPMYDLTYSVESLPKAVRYDYWQYQDWGKKYNRDVHLNNWLMGRTFVYCKEIMGRLMNRMIEFKTVYDKEKTLTHENIHLFTRPFIGFVNYTNLFKDVHAEGSQLTFDHITLIAEDVAKRSEISRKEVAHVPEIELETVLIDMLNQMTRDYTICYDKLQKLLPEYVSEYVLLMNLYQRAKQCLSKVRLTQAKSEYV